MKSYYLLNRPEILRKAKIKRDNYTALEKSMISKYNRDYYIKKRRRNKNQRLKKNREDSILIKFEQKETVLSFD